MPGKRNLARERAAHDSDAKFREFHQLLITQVPSYDRALIGRHAILEALDGYGIKRLTGKPLTWRMVKSWRRHKGFPMLGAHRDFGRFTSHAWSTQHAILAWLLSRWPGDCSRVFRVSFTPAPPREASHRLSRGVRSAPPPTFIA
jgi:hypothetical protein